jgi:hypothetical protein
LKLQLRRALEAIKKGFRSASLLRKSRAGLWPTAFNGGWLPALFKQCANAAKIEINSIFQSLELGAVQSWRVATFGDAAGLESSCLKISRTIIKINN